MEDRKPFLDHWLKVQSNAMRSLVILGIFLSILLASAVGSALAIPPGIASPVWPAAGIAAAALLLFGPKMWPAIAAASFSHNLFTEATTIAIASSLLIATGATLQALTIYASSRRFFNHSMMFTREPNVWVFLVLAGPACCAISATFGVISLYLFGDLSANKMAIQWLAWWAGDSIGVVTLLPFTLYVFSKAPILSREFLYNASPILITLTLVVVGNIIINQLSYAKQREHLENAATQIYQDTSNALSNVFSTIKHTKLYFENSDNITDTEFQGFVQGSTTESSVTSLSFIVSSGSSAKGSPQQFINKRSRLDSTNRTAPVLEWRSQNQETTEGGHVSDDSRSTFNQTEITARKLFVLPTNIIITEPTHNVTYGAGALVAVAQTEHLLEKASASASAFGLGFSLRLKDNDETKEIFRSGKATTEASDFSLEFSLGDTTFTLDIYKTKAFEFLYAEILLAPFIVLAVILSIVVTGSTIATVNRHLLSEVKIRHKTKEISQELNRRIAAEENMSIAMKKAEEAAAAKSDFLARMSHEIRTPMNAVVGLLDVLKYERLNDRQRETVTHAKEAATSLLDIINDVLDFSKIEAGKLTIEETDFSPVALSRSLYNMFSTAADDGNIRLLIYTTHAADVTITSDPTRIRQVISNLLSNAIKYSQQRRPGGVVECVIKLDQASHHDPRLTICVSDNGIGISAEQQKILFQPFSQADESTSRLYGGTGLGLAICSDIVNVMNGEISVESEIGEGSQFTISIPVKTKQSISPPEPHIALNGRTCHVVGFPSNISRAIRDDIKLAGLHAIKNSFLEPKDHNPADCFIVDATSYDYGGRQFLDRAVAENLHVVVVGDDYHHKIFKDNSTIAFIGRSAVSGRDIYKLVSAVFSVADTTRSQPAPYTNSAFVHDEFDLPKTGIHDFSQKKILVVDDNRMNRRVISEQMKLLGVQADVVDNGNEAIQEISGGSYDLVLTDLHMPHMDGISLTQRLREKGFDEDTLPIIGLSADTQPEIIKAAFSAGINEFIQKPATIEAIGVLICV